MHVGIEINGRFFNASIQIGRQRRERKMVDWDDIAKQKAEERQRLTDERKARQEDRAAHEAALVGFLSECSNRVKEKIDERNASIPLPGKRINFNSMGPKGFQVQHAAALLRAEISKRDDNDVLAVKTSGIDADGKKTSEEKFFKLTPAGGEFAITRYSGYGHDEAVTIEALVEDLLYTFAWYIG